MGIDKCKIEIADQMRNLLGQGVTAKEIGEIVDDVAKKTKRRVKEMNIQTDGEVSGQALEDLAPVMTSSLTDS